MAGAVAIETVSATVAMLDVQSPAEASSPVRQSTSSRRSAVEVWLATYAALEMRASMIECATVRRREERFWWTVGITVALGASALTI